MYTYKLFMMFWDFMVLYATAQKICAIMHKYSMVKKRVTDVYKL